MKIIKPGMLLGLFLILQTSVFAQGIKAWNNKECAVVLTYDDAIDADIDNVLPVLDSLKLKGTFYIIGPEQVYRSTRGKRNTNK